MPLKSICLATVIGSAFCSLAPAAEPAMLHLEDNDAAAAGRYAALAPTPPMGWNSWNCFRCDVSQELIRGAADAMVASGMKEAGYEYVVIDDCWQVGRDRDGNIVVDKERFPDGIRALADAIHAKGLKFGIYTCAGTHTCQKRPGSRGYEYQDMRQYAEWGVDYIKVDWCHSGKKDWSQNPRSSYGIFKDAIIESGRPMVLSICEWGVSKPWEWAPGVGHLWRTTYDIGDTYAGGERNHIGWTKILDQQVGLAKHAGPGRWNDPDMLEVGNGGQTDEEYRAHFGMWCMLAAPLMAGNDLSAMSDATRETLTNAEAIAVNQDPLGKQATKVRDSGDHELWVKPLSGGDKAVALLNRGESAAEISFTWEEIGLDASSTPKLRDLWRHEDVAPREDGYTATAPSHGMLMLRVSTP